MAFKVEFLRWSFFASIGIHFPTFLSFQFVLLCGLVAVASAGILPGHLSKVVEVESPPHYDFSYSVNDPNTGDVKQQQESRVNDVVQGSYSLVEPDGHRRIVHYTADDHNGFNAVVQREGTVHQTPVHGAAVISKQIVPVQQHLIQPHTVAVAHQPQIAIAHQPQIAIAHAQPQIALGHQQIALGHQSIGLGPQLGLARSSSSLTLGGLGLNGLGHGLAVSGLGVNSLGYSGLGVNGLGLNGVAVNGLGHGLAVNGLGHGLAVNGLGHGLALH